MNGVKERFCHFAIDCTTRVFDISEGTTYCILIKSRGIGASVTSEVWTRFTTTENPPSRRGFVCSARDALVCEDNSRCAQRGRLREGADKKKILHERFRMLQSGAFIFSLICLTR